MMIMMNNSAKKFNIVAINLSYIIILHKIILYSIIKLFSDLID